MKRIISVFLALVMILSTMSIGAFAADGDGGFSITATVKSSTSATVTWSGANDGSKITITPLKDGKTAGSAATVTGKSGSTDITGLVVGGSYKFKAEFTNSDGATETVTTNELIALPASPAKVTGLYTYSAYNSIALEWNPVAGATSYKVYRNGKYIASVKPTSKSVFDSKKLAYINTGIKDDNTYKYQVTAVNSNGESVKSDTVSDSRVRQMYVNITFSKSRKLKSHDSGKKVTTTFKKGFKVDAYGYRLGRYHFKYKGHTYYVNYMSTKSAKAKYNGLGKWNYTNREAEYFIKTSGIKSKTNYMIWASLYTQHIYILKKNSNGVWRVSTISYKGTSGSNWEISSGKASTPSPTGTNLQIFRRQANKRGVVWWNYFHSQTSIHGKAGKAPFGKPASSGCLRNPDKLASVIYHVIPLKTRVIVY